MRFSNRFKIAFILGIAAWYVLGFWHPVPLQGSNADLGHHLLFGKIMWESKTVVNINLVSYTFPDFHFVNSQWLSEVIMYLWQTQLGIKGLELMAVLIITTVVCLLYWDTINKYRWEGVLVTALITTAIFADRTEVRPELFSWFCLVFETWLIEKYRNHKSKIIWFAIPIQILWVNLHIYFFTGNILVLVLFLESLLKHKSSFKNREVIELLLLNVSMGLANLINPNFINGALNPLFVLNDYGYRVIENLNFFSALKEYGNITFVYFGLTVSGLAWLMYKYRQNFKFYDLAIAVYFTFMGFYAVRSFPLFALGIIPILVKYFHYFLENKDYVARYFTVGVAVFVVIPGNLRSLQIHGFGWGVKDEAYKATLFLKENNIKGPIFNNYNIGNYLEYKLYPKEKVFVDGNPEEYPASFFDQIYYPTEQDPVSFEKTDQIYHFNVVYYDHVNQTENDNPLLKYLINNKDWQLVYLDQRIVIFLKIAPSNQDVLKKYSISDSNYNVKSDYLSCETCLRNLSNLFRIFRWYELMYQMDLKYLDYQPHNCVALRHVVAIENVSNSDIYQQHHKLYTQYCK